MGKIDRVVELTRRALLRRLLVRGCATQLRLLLLLLLHFALIRVAHRQRHDPLRFLQQRRRLREINVKSNVQHLRAAPCWKESR